MYRNLLFLLICVVTSAANAQTLTVYPGDANNNGIVNNIDFLNLGLAYNYFGPARDSMNGNGLSFLPQDASPWPQQFLDGTNVAHADCNGDGLVNYYYDAFPVYVNYGMSLPDSQVVYDAFVAGLQGVDPQLTLNTSAIDSGVGSGQSFELPIELGDEDHPADDLYGIAFSMFVDPQFVDADQVNFNFSEISWANPDNERISMFKKTTDNRIDVAWVRTDHNNRNGFGRFGKADIIIIIDVIGVQQSFAIRLDSIRMVDKFGNITSVAGDTVWIEVLPDATSSGEDPLQGKSIRVSPNPVQDILYIDSPEQEVEDLLLIDALGRPVIRLQPHSNHIEIPMQHLPSGLYILEARTAQGVITRMVRH